MEEGQVVMVTEHRVFDGGNRKGQIVIRVRPRRGIYLCLPELTFTSCTLHEQSLPGFRKD